MDESSRRGGFYGGDYRHGADLPQYGAFPSGRAGIGGNACDSYSCASPALRFYQIGDDAFSGWLLGAMVAPTPTSALLHSSTMVKAGVFLIIKLCPALGNNHAGTMAMFVGGITFFLRPVPLFHSPMGKSSCLFHNFQFGTDRLLCGYRFL